MHNFYEGCESCSYKLGLKPEQCFECAQVKPWLYGDAHSLGRYFCRALPEHHTCKWSKGIIKLKQGVSPVIRAIGRMTASYLQTHLKELKPYIITNVPTWMFEEKQRMFPQLDFGVTRRLALATFRSLQNSQGVDCHQLLALTGSKKKRQRECSSYSQRQRNTAGAYMVVAAHRVKGKNIILLDDVLTSGATLASCSTALMQAEAKTVVPLVLAVTAKKREDSYGFHIDMHTMQNSVCQRELTLPSVS